MGNSKPVKEYRKGGIKATIWQNEWQGKPSFSITFKKSYKTKEGAWKDTDFFSPADMDALASVVAYACSKSVKERVIDIKPKSAPQPQAPVNGDSATYDIEPDLVGDENPF